MIDTLAYLLPALGCAAMMVAMMWMMGRGQGRSEQPSAPSRAEEIQALRAEIDALRPTPRGASSTDG